MLCDLLVKSNKNSKLLSKGTGVYNQSRVSAVKIQNWRIKGILARQLYRNKDIKIIKVNVYKTILSKS